MTKIYNIFLFLLISATAETKHIKQETSEGPQEAPEDEQDYLDEDSFEDDLEEDLEAFKMKANKEFTNWMLEVVNSMLGLDDIQSMWERELTNRKHHHHGKQEVPVFVVRLV